MNAAVRIIGSTGYGTSRDFTLLTAGVYAQCPSSSERRQMFNKAANSHLVGTASHCRALVPRRLIGVIQPCQSTPPGSLNPRIRRQ
jgi:hypothetical protein